MASHCIPWPLQGKSCFLVKIVKFCVKKYDLAISDSETREFDSVTREFDLETRMFDSVTREFDFGQFDALLRDLGHSPPPTPRQTSFDAVWRILGKPWLCGLTILQANGHIKNQNLCKVGGGAQPNNQVAVL